MIMTYHLGSALEIVPWCSVGEPQLRSSLSRIYANSFVRRPQNWSICWH